MVLPTADEKMQKNKAYPSDTEYFFGMTKEENESLPFPYPPISQCIVAIHPDGGVIITSNSPKNRLIPINPEIIINITLRKAEIKRENASITWV